ncbi:MAG TPA: Gfo/Idh/MocA family oxidoreductase [Phycisphaerae bacterium]|mgnify:CR=1 FL=1|nr:Gfo/Idh/MocA family oxidoreductase [Phycisphaerae bacterium]
MAEAKRNGAEGKAAGVRKSIRLAFVGTGNWARRYHLPSLKHIRDTRMDGWDLSLHGIYGIRHDEAVQLAEQYAFGRVYSRLEEILDDPDLDAVAVVITPEAAQDVLLKLLVRNAPLFTEKPPGADYAQARELAEKVHVLNVVGYNRRYNLLNNRFKELLGTVGKIEQVQGEMYRINRREPHFVMHTGGHLINLMEYLFGDIRQVRNEKQKHPATGETVHVAHVAFDSGLGGRIVLAPCSDRHWEGVTVRAAGQTTILHSPHNDGAGEVVIRKAGADSKGEVVARSGQRLPILEEGYALEYLDFFAAMADGRPTRSNFRNAVNTMRVAEAIETGKDLN